MSWALIRESDGVWLAGPLDEEPAPDAGERVVMVALGYPDTVAWSPERAGFVDLVVAPALISVGRFKLLFTQPERIAIRAAASANAQVEDFLDLLTGFTEGVSLTDPLLVDSVAALAAAELITSDRAAAVLAGEAP